MTDRAEITTEKLTDSEHQELQTCEAIIDRGLQTYFEVGSALQQIRDNRLYRASYATYEEYCQSRWGMSSRNANRLVNAAETAENLRPIGLTLPANEAQARPLSGLSPDQQREAWTEAVGNAPDGKPTAAQVSAAASKFAPPKFKINGPVLYQGVRYRVSSFTSGGNYSLQTIAGKIIHDIPGAEIEAINSVTEGSEPPPERVEFRVGDWVQTRVGHKRQIAKIDGRFHYVEGDPRAHFAETLTKIDPLASTPPRVKTPSVGDLIKLTLIAANIHPARVVAHTNGNSGTYTAAFDSNGTHEQAVEEARSYAALIRAAGFQILNVGADIPPGSQTLGLGGENTPMVYFADEDYQPSNHVPETPSTYAVLYIDPPWQFEVWNRETGQGRSAESHYDTMDFRALASLPMQRLMDEDCAVFLWATWPLLQEALYLGRAWGLEYKTCAFNWVKLNKQQTDTPFTGMGYWTRANSEICLLFTRGTPHRQSKGVPQMMIEWTDGFVTETVATPIGAHSEKPDAIYERIEALVDGPYCEVFAREQRKNWAAIGNEIDGRDIREVLSETAPI